MSLGQQYYSVGEKPTVILYTSYINRYAGPPNKTKTLFLYGSMVLLVSTLLLVLSSYNVLQYYSVVMLGYDWWLCMVINISVLQYNGGLLPDMILLTQCYYHCGTRLNNM